MVDISEMVRTNGHFLRLPKVYCESRCLMSFRTGLVVYFLIDTIGSARECNGRLRAFLSQRPKRVEGRWCDVASAKEHDRVPILKNRAEITRKAVSLYQMETTELNIPQGITKEDIKAREKVIKDFYAHWISENPEKKIWNDNLQDYILVKFISINETYNKAARRYESTLAVFRLTEVLQKAILIEEKPTKPYDKNQKSFEKLLIMRHDDVKLIVGVQKSNQDKVQYSLSAIVPSTEQ